MDAPEYAASVFSKAYTFAVPIVVPVIAVAFTVVFLWLDKLIMLLILIPNLGVPLTLFIWNLFPNLNGTDDNSISFLSLGFSISNIVLTGLSISYPLTYAFPGDTFNANKSSVGVAPWSVFSPKLNTPSLEIPSFKDSAGSILKLPTE